MRRPIAAAAITVSMTLAAFGLHGSRMSAAPKQTLTVALSPTSAIAGSTGNTLTFTFVATEGGPNRATVTIPASVSGAPWSPPQAVNPSGAGYVTTQVLGCNSAVLAGITGAGPWTLAVDYKCATNKSFALTYRATAAARVGAYVFATQVQVGLLFQPTTVQPVVTVSPGPAASFAVTGLAAAIAGTAQTATATARDAFGNLVPSYAGSAAITSSDPQAVLPPGGSFVAGARTFAVTLKTAGSQSVSATDGVVTGGQTVSITAAAATSMDLAGLNATTAAGASQSGFVTLYDQYANVATGYVGTVHFTPSGVATPANATLPADHTFTAADNGSYQFTGLVLTKAGSSTITVADTVNLSLHDDQAETVLPGEVASLALVWPDTYLPFGFRFSFPGGPRRNCNVWPYDAHGNTVLTYTGTIAWTTTAAHYSLAPQAPYQPPPPAFIGESSYNCEFYSPGTQSLTVTDVNNASLSDTQTFQVLTPSPKADDFAVLDPTHRGGVTEYTLDPLANDPEPLLFARRAVLTLAGVGQATYTENGAKYQLGVAQLDALHEHVIWELNPPAGATASDPDATLRRCYPDGVGCAVTQPITMPYTITDSVSSVDSTIALTISTPAFQFPTPTIVFDQHFVVPSAVPGAPALLIPAAIQLIPAVLSSPDPATGLRSLTLTGPIQGCPSGVGCSVQLTASVGVPTTDNFAAPVTISLAQPLTVTGSSSQRTFNSVVITSPPPVDTSEVPRNYYSALFNLAEPSCIDFATTPPTPILCPFAPSWDVDLIGLVNADYPTVQARLAGLGYRPTGICTILPGSSPNGTVTAVAHEVVTEIGPLGTPVTVHPHIGSKVFVSFTIASTCPER